MSRSASRTVRSIGPPGFLPTTAEELRQQGYAQLDVLIVTGDAYVDHPAFGPVLIARFLESKGYRVGLVAQPDWRSIRDVSRLGRPRLFVGVSAGNLDSMLNKLTAQRKVRSEDQFSPGGRPGLRPNRASVVYSNLCRQAFPGLPIVLGGIEASLRRIAHYDYWSDQVRRSILLDAKADLLVFGMGERAAWEIARRLDAGEPIGALRDVPGTAHVLNRPEQWQPLAETASSELRSAALVLLPSYEAVVRSKVDFAHMTRLFERETSALDGRRMMQIHGQQALVLNAPSKPLSEAEMDALYALPFRRLPHPSYAPSRIPAYETIKHSVVILRGCFGGCSFCSIGAHEGRFVQSRSEASVLAELRSLGRLESYRGVVTDLGGPTANMYRMRCREPRAEAACRRPSCLFPKTCSRLGTDHGPLIALMRAARSAPGVKRVFVASGIRVDLAERSPEYVQELARHHVGGQLSVAPEHGDAGVLRLMRKPELGCYERFARAFAEASTAANKEQYLVPYFITGHPGSSFEDTVELALALKAHNLRPREVQDFIPTPLSVATAMYHTGLDPTTRKPVTVARELRDKRLLKALLYWWDPSQHARVREALRRAGRTDLIGTGPRALVPASKGPGRGTRS
ncbi:MAG: YgiQ family radical SAM protein [Polyangiaceae bacterium]|nr:YgiQ family radical SAM protein [Polyangiaceae bacterium]